MLGFAKRRSLVLYFLSLVDVTSLSKTSMKLAEMAGIDWQCTHIQLRAHGFWLLAPHSIKPSSCPLLAAVDFAASLEAQKTRFTVTTFVKTFVSAVRQTDWCAT